MTKSIKDISHKNIDSLSDGVFSIALTLLGIEVVALVPDLTHSGDVLGSLAEHLPTFIGFFLGFIVLFSWWYQYHVTGQYVVGTNVTIVWVHGFVLLWVALMPFAVAMLAETLNTDDRKWGILFFTICLFGQYWTTVLVSLPAIISSGGRVPTTWSDDFPLDPQKLNKFLIILQGLSSVVGIITAILSLMFPWVALGICGLFILSSMHPVKYVGRIVRSLENSK
jgi:uncharacterized membrane protein